MSLFDEVKKLASEHPNEIKTGLDKLTDLVDHQTGGKYHDQIGKAEQAADNFIDKNAGQQPNPGMMPQQQPQQQQMPPQQPQQQLPPQNYGQ